MYDVIIVGGGPAGLTAAIYSSRYKLSTLVLSKTIGGAASTAHKICNYPSYENINGYELMQKFTTHAKSLGAEIKYEEVLSIEKKDNYFIVKSENSSYEGKKVIYTAGTKRERLNVAGEGKFIGKGVSYCTACDGPFFKDKKVVVVGGGDAALSSALMLSSYAKEVIIIHRGKEFTKGDPSWQIMIEKDNKIKKMFNEEVVEIIGDKKVEKIKLKSGKIIETDGIFIEIGAKPDSEILKSLKVKIDSKGYVIIDCGQRTNIPGFFSAGDVTSKDVRQVVVAAGDGAVAAYQIYWELKEENNKGGK